MRLLIIFFLFSIVASGQQTEKHLMNLKAIRLSDSAYKLVSSNFNTINLKSAINLLQQANALDTNDNLKVIYLSN